MGFIGRTTNTLTRENYDFDDDDDDTDEDGDCNSDDGQDDGTNKTRLMGL